MARSTGPAGAANGKISKMVFYQLNGQEVIRGLGVKKKIKSKNVLAQNNSIKLLMAFFNKIKPLLRLGLKIKPRVRSTTTITWQQPTTACMQWPLKRSSPYSCTIKYC